MNLLTRRGFLEHGFRLALLSSVSAAWHVPAFLRRALAQGALPTGTRKVLFIFLRGGNDGLNTLIPRADDAYNAQNRPTLYLPPPDPWSTAPGRMPSNPDLNRVLDLGNGFAGLHPALKDLGPLYNDGHLALIHRVGYPRQSRSHFDSQRYWENGTPRENFTGSGLFYRAVVETGLHAGRQFPAVSVQRNPPLLLRGPLAMPNLSDPARYDVLGVSGGGADRQKLLEALTRGHQEPHPERDNRPLLFGTGARLADSIEALQAIGLANNDFFDTDGTTHLFPLDAASNQKGFSSSAYEFFRNLKVAAQILAHTDAVVAGTQLEGFDTHGGQGALTGTHARLLSYLGWGFYAVRQFLRGVNPQFWEDTVVVTLSEFGRTSVENGSQGTDHAEASAMFVAGGRVRGGVYQCDGATWAVGPSGAQFSVDRRYLGRTVDYRSVLGEIIRKHLGASPEVLTRILPGYAEESREHLLTGGLAPDGVRIVGELGLL